MPRFTWTFFVFALFLHVLFTLSCNPEARSVTSEPMPPTESPTPPLNESDRISDVQFEAWQKESFQPVIDRWLAGSLTQRFVGLKTKNPYPAVSEQTARVELLDVNGDGDKELALQTFCAPVGNCEFWLFEKIRDGYRVILKTEMVQSFELRETRSNGYFHLETRAHGSAVSGGIAVHKFNGDEYKIAECFGYEYKPSGRHENNGQAIFNEKPTLTPSDCDKWPGK